METRQTGEYPTLRRVRFTPFWKLTRWGFLFRNDPWSALKLNRGCDEWHNRSRWFMVPLVGEIVVFVGPFDRSGDEHLYAKGPDGWSGLLVPSCGICTEIMEEFDAD